MCIQSIEKVPFNLNYVLREIQTDVHCGYIEKNVVHFCEVLIWLQHFENFKYNVVKSAFDKIPDQPANIMCEDTC